MPGDNPRSDEATVLPAEARFPPNEIISLLDVNRTHNLAESTARNLHFGELVELVGGFEALRDIELGYGSSAGLPALREVLGVCCGIAADKIVTTQGTSLALFLLAFELCRAGDEVVLATPCFPPSRDTFEACGVATREVSLRFADGYRLDPDRLAQAMTARTRLVSIASPQNPSGVSVDEATLRALLDRMSQRGRGRFSWSTRPIARRPTAPPRSRRARRSSTRGSSSSRPSRRPTERLACASAGSRPTTPPCASA